MSYLQRQAQFKGNKHSSNSRNGSKKSTPASSKPGSRAESRYQSDAEDDEFQVNKFAERMNVSALSQQLSAIQLEEESARVARKTSYQENFETLIKDRRSTSLEQRQDALERITQTLANKYNPELYSNGDIETLHKAIVTGRSVVEQTRAARALVIMALLDIDDSAEFITETTLPALEPIFTDEDQESSIRSYLLTCHSLLLYYINLGASGFGLESKIEMLLNVANETSTEDSIVSCAALLGIGLLTSVTGSRNTVIEDTLPSIVELLKSQDSDVRKTAGKVIALMYELYDFSDQEDGTTDEDLYAGFKYGIDTVDNADLVYDLSELVGESAKSIARKTKSELRSVFRKVLSTIEARLVTITEDLDRDDSLTDHEVAAEAISHLRLSKTKAIPIDTWNQLNLSSVLKWLYGDGLHTQVANNPLVGESIANAGSVHLERVSRNATTRGTADTPFDSTDKVGNKKISQKREVDIKKEREMKQQAQHEHLHGESVY